MIRVGLFGEAPHDTQAISNLLDQHFAGKIKFFPMVENIRGSQIEMQWVKHRLRVEYQIEKPQFVVFIRDLDGFEDDKKMLNLRNVFFRDFSTRGYLKNSTISNLFTFST